MTEKDVIWHYKLIWFITYKYHNPDITAVGRLLRVKVKGIGCRCVQVEMVHWTASEKFYKNYRTNGCDTTWLWHMVKYSTSVDSFSSDLVLSDRYTIDIQPVEALNLELIWDACENASQIMTVKPYYDFDSGCLSVSNIIYQ